MAGICTPITTVDDNNKIKSLSDYMEHIARWQETQAQSPNQGYMGNLWYRGVNKRFQMQIPGVYRLNFTDRAKKWPTNISVENKRLRLEREMIGQFRTAGAAFLEGYSNVQVYFAAQHYGMPTRLLDWSTTPLAGLFFACDSNSNEDGVVYAMDATKVIEKTVDTPNGKLYQAVLTMRHWYVKYAIDLSFWVPEKNACPKVILPIRPDVVTGRIGQQGSCFTLHMHGSKDVTNKSFAEIVIDGTKKDLIRDELHRLNINQFTIYNDLDHLSKEINRCWGL